MIDLHRFAQKGVRTFFKMRPSAITRKKLTGYGEGEFHYFFGYFDVSPFSDDGSKLLCMRTPISKPRPPNQKDFAEVGYFETHDPIVFHKIGETSAWCWQQGSRLQWWNSDHVIFNRMVGSTYGCEIVDLKGNSIRLYKNPIYTLNKDRTEALFLNFEMLQKYRPGYGYPEAAGMEWSGIHKLNMRNGESTLIVRDENLKALKDFGEDPKTYFNHLCYSPIGSQFVFFHIWDNRSERKVLFYLGDSENGDVTFLSDQKTVSHFCWKDENTLLYSVAEKTGKTRYYLVNCKNNILSAFYPKILKWDGHPSYDPSGKFLLIDSYGGDYSRYQKLYLFHLRHERLERIAQFYRPEIFEGEFKDDLHPRWSPDGKKICVDSAHQGRRRLYVLEVE